jgi:hypothetical protein
MPFRSIKSNTWAFIPLMCSHIRFVTETPGKDINSPSDHVQVIARASPDKTLRRLRRSKKCGIVEMNITQVYEYNTGIRMYR